MTRIVMAVPVFPKRSETFIVSKLVGLAGRGLDVHVLCSREDRAAHADFPALAGLEDRIHAAATGPGRAALAAGTARGVAGAARAGRLAAAARTSSGRDGHRLAWLGEDAWLARLAPAVVHAEFGTVARDRAAAVRACGARLTVSFRGYDLAFAGLGDPGYYDEVWRSVAAVHVLGDDLWRRARARGCPPDVPHAVIPPAVDLARVGSPPERRGGARGATADDPVRLLSVGRLEWKKGHEYGLRAVRELADRGVHARWRLVGAGDQAEAVAFGAHELGLADRVELVGACPPDEVAGHLAWADVLVHPSVSEGFANAVLEAQAAGLAVVATDADGLAENVEDGVTGTIVGRRDPVALADAVAALAADGARRVAMGRAGRRRVEEHFTLDRQLDLWEAFYARATEGTAP